MEQVGGEFRGEGACYEAHNVIPGFAVEGGGGTAAAGASSAAPRKRPPTQCDENEIPRSNRPRATPSIPDAVDHAGLLSVPCSARVDEAALNDHQSWPMAMEDEDLSPNVRAIKENIAAAGIINLARAQFQQPNQTEYYPRPNTASIGALVAATPHNVTHFHNAVVHLSIVKAVPSFTEPWKKLPLASLTGTGVIISWNGSENGFSENNSFEEGEGAAYSIENTTENDGGRKANNSVRILTSAHPVQYATSIRAHIQTCSMSMRCTVECINLGMDLALLKVDFSEMTSDWKHFALPLTTNLPHLGVEVTCIRSPKSGLFARSEASSMHHYCGRLSTPSQSSSRHVGLDVCCGTVSGYYADEDEHYLLRMKLNLSMPITHGGGGCVVDFKSNIVGIISSSSQVESTGFHSVIPSVVIAKFLDLIHSPPKQPDTIYSSPSYNTDGECSAGGSRNTKDEILWVQSDSQRKIRVQNSARGFKYTPGIPHLCITGFQPLENKSLRRSMGLEEGGEFVDGCGVRILGVNCTTHPHDEKSECQSQNNEDFEGTIRTDDVLLAIDTELVRLDGTVRLSPGRENERVDFRWLISQRFAGTGVKLTVMRQGKRIQLHVTLLAPKYLVPRFDEGEGKGAPSYLICGGCVFVPLTQAWLTEMIERQNAQSGNMGNPLPELGFRRYLQEQRDRDQEIVILSHVLADDVNFGYHSFENMVLSSVDGKRPNSIADLSNLLVKQENGKTIEFRCSYPHLPRAKIGKHSNFLGESNFRST